MVVTVTSLTLTEEYRLFAFPVHHPDEVLDSCEDECKTKANRQHLPSTTEMRSGYLEGLIVVMTTATERD